MDLEIRLEEELQGIINQVNQNDIWIFSSERWTGTKEELNEFKIFLNKLNSRGWIEVQIEPHMNGDIYLIKVTPEGYMKNRGAELIDNETQLEEVLQGIINQVNQNDIWIFSSERWTGTKEELNEFKFFLNKLNSRGWIEVQIEPHMNGDIYLIKVTPEGYMKCKDLREK